MTKSLSGRRAPAPKPVHVSQYLNRNTAIIPASQLKAIEAWQRQANRLPDGKTLLVLPAGNGRMEVVGQRICVALNSRGRAVSVTMIYRMRCPGHITVPTRLKMRTGWPIWPRSLPGRGL